MFEWSTIRTGWVRAATCLLVSCASSPAISGSVPPIKAFLTLPESTAQILRQSFKLTRKELPSGVYFSHPDISRVRPEVSKQLSGAFQVNMSYLVTDVTLRQLYGEAGWEFRGTQAVTRSGENEPTSVAFDEFRWRAGWVDTTREDGLVVRQYWLVSPSGLGWQLFEKGAEESRSSFFASAAKFLVPISGGAFLTSKDGGVTVAFANGKSFDRFSFTDFDGVSHPQLAFQLASSSVELASREKRQAPLTYYHAPSDTLLFVGWRRSETELPLADTHFGPGKSAEIYALNCRTLEVTEHYRGVQFPVAILETGVVLADSKTQALQLIGFDWARAEMGQRSTLSPPGSEGMVPRIYPNSVRYFGTTAQKKNTFRVLSPSGTLLPEIGLNETVLDRDARYKIEMIDYPVDLINEVRTGKRPWYWRLPELSDWLPSQLGGVQETWGVMAYAKGEEPIDYLSSYLWELEEKLQDPPAGFRGLKHVFVVGPKQFARAAAKPNYAVDFEQALKDLRDSIDGRPAMVVFLDLASTSEELNAVAESNSLNRFLRWKATFRDCAEKGTCRTLAVLRAEMVEALRRKDPAALEGIPQLAPPTLRTLEERKSLARALFGEAAVERKLTFGEPVFRASFLALEKRREDAIARGKSELTYLKSYYRDLVSRASTLLPKAEREISLAVYDKADRSLAGLAPWTLDVVPFGEAAEPVPMWVHSNGERNESLTNELLTQWTLDPTRLIRSEGRAHALFVAEEIEGNMPLYLLRPKVHPLKILNDGTVEWVHLHPDGAFFFSRRQGVLRLIFYRVNFLKQNDNEEKEGTITLLADDLPFDLFAFGEVSYRAGKVVVEAKNAKRVFGTQREENPDEE